MARSKRVVVSGIPGSGSTDFCSRYVVADPERLRMKRYHLGDMLLSMAQEAPQKPPIFADSLLNLQPDLLNALTDRVFDSTLAMITQDQESYDRLVIDMHAQFFWNDVFINPHDWRYLAKLDPDLFVTLIEKPSTIRARQLATSQGLLQNHSLRDLLLWQNIGVNFAAGLAANLGKLHYVLPGKQDPLTIESLLRSAFLIYFQMPMTEANSEADDLITAFKERILDIGRRLTGLPTPLIDPRTIDIESGAGLAPQDERAIRIHTVHRDVNWYIPEVTDQIAYYPKGTKLSKGVGDETTRGFETGKHCFVVDPDHHHSPFMDIATRVFVSEEEFFDFFPAYMQQRLELFKRIL